ncbi:hypothetical protein [Hymenobacter ruber]
MAVNPDDPTIPTTCEDFAFDPDLNPGDCYTPAVNVGPGLNAYAFDEPFAAAPTATEIATRLTAGTGIGPLIGTFSKAANTASTIRVDGRDVTIPSNQSWAVKITNTKPVYRELARQTQNGGISKHWYIVDANNQWFGGQNGICPRADGGPASLVLSQVIPTGEQEPQTIEGTISAFGKFDAKVIVSPVALVN